MERPEVYEGEKDYIFVSYSHQDNENVWTIILRMRNDGYRVWYDDGICPGTEWDNDIAEHIENCRYFCAFMSENYMRSENCLDELSYAKDLGKDMILIYLKSVKLAKGLAMRMNRIQAIHKYTLSDDAFYKKLYAVEGVYRCLEKRSDSQKMVEADHGKYQRQTGNDTVQKPFPIAKIRKSGQNGRGPERPRYTRKEQIDHPVFNSVIDNELVGNEGDFVRIAEEKEGAVYTSNLELEAGKRYEVWIYYHNDASVVYNDKSHNYAGVARGARLSATFPDILTEREKGEITAKITAVNCEPVWDGVSVTAKENMALQFVAASAKIYNGCTTSGAKISKNLFTKRGVYLGRDELDGTIFGKDSGQIIYTIQTTAVAGAEQYWKIGNKFYSGGSVKRDYKKAFMYYMEAAKLGDARAQSSVGDMYLNGTGVECDYKKAVKWYQKSADQGYSFAQRVLGYMYQKGYGVERDDKEAVRWYQRAANQGNAGAKFSLGTMYFAGTGVRQDYEEAVRWFKESAEQGDSLAQFLLATLYYCTNSKVGQDYKEAAKWSYKLAVQGDKEAQNMLGTMYYNGNGVEQNYEEAAKWFKASSEAGVADAQYLLGVMYCKGEGVEKNIALGVKYIEKAAKQGHEEAKKALKNISKYGDIV